MKEIISISEKFPISVLKNYLYENVEDLRLLLPSEIIYIIEKFIMKKEEKL
jgi:hypothetical protein